MTLRIKFDPGEFHAMHELRVGQAFGANSSVDTLDPKRAETALLNFAVAVGVLAGLFDRLTRNANGVFATRRPR